MGWKASWNNTTYQMRASVPAPTGATLTGHTLTAQWRELYTYTIEYRDNGDGLDVTGMPGTDGHVKEGGMYTVPTTTPVRIGYLFAGWYTSWGNTTTLHQQGASIPAPEGPTLKHTLGVKWKVQLTFKFDTGDPADRVPDITVISGDKFNVAKEPLRTDHVFMGWQEHWGEKRIIAAGGVATAPDAAAHETYTFTALWHRLNVYAIAYNAGTTDTVSGMPNTATVQEKSSLTVSSMTPARAGYRFMGWDASWDGAATLYQPGASIDAPTGSTLEGHSLTAKWEIQHTIRYVTNAAAIPDVRVGNGATFTTADVPERDGYTFFGWKQNWGGNAIITAKTQITAPTSDAPGVYTLTAQWQAVSLVEYDGGDPPLVTPANITIVGQPEDMTVTPGGLATFDVGVWGGDKAVYQWVERFGTGNGIIKGATDPRLTLNNVDGSDNGIQLACRIGNEKGSTMSSPATLRIKGAFDEELNKNTPKNKPEGMDSLNNPSTLSNQEGTISLIGEGLDPNDKLLINHLTDGEDYEFFFEAMDDGDVAQMFDISLESGEPSSDEPMYLSFSVGPDYTGKNFSLTHRKAGGSTEIFEGTVDENGVVSFGPVYSLSPFMLMKGGISRSAVHRVAGVSAVPDTGDNSAPWAGVVIAGTALICAVCAYVIRKREQTK